MTPRSSQRSRFSKLKRSGIEEKLCFIRFSSPVLSIVFSSIEILKLMFTSSSNSNSQNVLCARWTILPSIVTLIQVLWYYLHSLPNHQSRQLVFVQIDSFLRNLAQIFCTMFWIFADRTLMWAYSIYILKLIIRTELLNLCL